MILLIDIGNTRIKWATHGPGGLSPQQALAHAHWSVADVHQHITSRMPAPQRVVVSNVAGPKRALLLTDAAQQAWGIVPEFAQSAAAAGGIRNGYSQPEKLGVDRWLAMMAAYEIVSHAVCVVSVGTAMTVDAVDGSGRHLGGLIVPGPDLMKHCLMSATSDIAARAAESLGSDGLFAADTAAAVRHGTTHALAALITHSVAALQQQTNELPAVILTGGASSQVESLLACTYQSIPDLVLRGLRIHAAG